MLVVALFGAPVPLGLMVWFAFAAPEFAKLFEEFGGPLPRSTAVVLWPWWSAVMIGGYLCALPATFVFPRTIQRDFAAMAVVLAGLLAVMASAACLYLPLFQVSQSLH